MRASGLAIPASPAFQLAVISAQMLTGLLGVGVAASESGPAGGDTVLNAQLLLFALLMGESLRRIAAPCLRRRADPLPPVVVNRNELRPFYEMVQLPVAGVALYRAWGIALPSVVPALWLQWWSMLHGGAALRLWYGAQSALYAFAALASMSQLAWRIHDVVASVPLTNPHPPAVVHGAKVVYSAPSRVPGAAIGLYAGPIASHHAQHYETVPSELVPASLLSVVLSSIWPTQHVPSTHAAQRVPSTVEKSCARWTAA